MSAQSRSAPAARADDGSRAPLRAAGAPVAKVIPLTRTRAVRGTFDYRLPRSGAESDDDPRIGIGSILRVPFGGRSAFGVVIDLAGHSELPPDRLAEPDAVLGSSIPAELVSLAAWMATEYCSTPARALGLVLPPGTLEGVRARRALVAELTEPGAGALTDAAARLTDGQRGLLERLQASGPRVAAELGTAALRRLESRGLVRLSHRERPRRPQDHAVGSVSAVSPALTGDQHAALQPILRALEGAERPPETFLLQGVTGSGKTEVYLQAVAATLAAGRSAIVLVPEIALTPQVLGRFQARFGDVVAVLHSALSVGERHDEWQRLRRGQARVCVGPRSAVFAPVVDLGLVIVDEEHESSYKHEGDPRYDARHVARERARAAGAVLVAGSATPRPESVVTGRRLRLPERIDGGAMPAVEVLDMRGRHHPLHPETRLALADLRRAGGKAIVMLNRRGWSNFLCCRSCGRVWVCPNCEVALVLHRGRTARSASGPARADPEGAAGLSGLIACHHCGHREPVPSRCGSCGSVSVARHGAGTERIEHELRDALGGDDFPIFRLDADSSGLEQRAATLQRFEQARSGALVGTQMVAKGHDFPDVALGVVLDADQTLRFPDFRAEERTFALVTQLAGRAGRGGDGGRVLVQTLAPDARPLEFARHHDSDGFLADELRRRRALGYPPFASLIRVVCSAEEEPLARRTAQAIADGLEAFDGAVLGPAPLFRLRGRARSQLVIKAADRAGAIAAVGRAVDRVGPGAARVGASVSVDVDPQ
ncbi:MAG TPA: primosomal protein N' [Solirubrobacteraceae bacterium]